MTGDTARLRELGKTPWKERYALIKEEFPSVDRLDWDKAFTDMDLLGRVLRDILKADRAMETQAGRGPRPVLDQKKAKERLRQFMGEDYSYTSFVETFSMLMRGRSIRSVAHKVGVNHTLIWALLNGKRNPDLMLMESIAKAFNKHPSFFMEYRIAYILGALGSQMDKAPEMTVDLYRRLKGLGVTDGNH